MAHCREVGVGPRRCSTEGCAGMVVPSRYAGARCYACYLADHKVKGTAKRKRLAQEAPPCRYCKKPDCRPPGAAQVVGKRFCGKECYAAHCHENGVDPRRCSNEGSWAGRGASNAE